MNSEFQTESAAASGSPNAADGTTSATALQEELHRRVGRNLLAYQGIEVAMKYLVAYALVEGTLHTAAENASKRFEVVFAKTMGQVAKAVFDEVLTSSPPTCNESPSPSEIYAATRFNIERHDPDGWEPLKARCQEVLKTRNELVHHLLRQRPRDTEEALNDLLTHLDETHRVAEQVRVELNELVRALGDARKAAASHLASTEGQEEVATQLARRIEIDLQLARGNVIAALRDVAAVTSRSDGWVVVAGALGRLGGDPRLTQDVELLKESWGRRTWWRRLFAESPDEFNLAEEPIPTSTKHPMTRAIYRMRDLVD